MSVTVELARELRTSDRTLRRAVERGTLRGLRPTPNRLEISREEREWARNHWPLVSTLLAALRSERGVRAAILIGSMARGDEHAGSDVDLAVEMSGAGIGQTVELERRLARRVGRPVHVLRIDGTPDPELMLGVLQDGRLMVDRVNAWSRLQRSSGHLCRRAARVRGERDEVLAAAWQELFAEAS